MRAGIVVLLLTTPFLGCIGTDDASEDDGATTATGDAVGGFSATSVYPGKYETGEAYSVVLEKGPFDLLAGVAEYVASDADGSDIQIGYVLPDVPEGTKVPVIVLASPYFPGLQDYDLHALEPRLTENFVPHGYAVAFVAVRGTGDSGGCMDLMGELERGDLDQAITWLGTQPWSNGNVGMIGVSYDGSTPWEVASFGNEHLKTIVPISGLSDIYNLEYRNGTAETRVLGGVTVAYWTSGFDPFAILSGRTPAHAAGSILCPDAAEGLEAELESGVTGERDRVSSYWNERNSRPGVEENYKGSILLVHGLQDWNVDPHHAYPWVNTLEDRGLVVKHYLGQWFHAWPDGDYLDEPIRRYDFAEMLLHWFDYHLKEDPAADIGPRAQVQDNTGAWRNEETWPPRDTTPVQLFVAPGGLVWEEPTTTDARPIGPDASIVFGEPVHTSGFLPAGGEALCALCQAWWTEPLEKDLRFAGLPTLHLTVTPTGPTGTVAAFLYARDGAEYTRLGWTSMDLRFADGGEVATPIVPGQPIVAKMQFEPLDVFVPAGQELVLLLSSGAQDDRAPVTPPLPVLIEAGPGSVLTLDTFERGPEAFFEVPTS